jgi:23S rRNA pseudouridine1911/1915/1917 synthase
LTGRIETLLARDPRDRKRFAVCTRGGKEARSSWRVLANWGTYSLLLLGLETGRTHQLRVHLRHIGCPILGDPIYGIKDSRFGMASLMLHARRLGIRVPLTDSKNLVWRRFVAPIPSRMKSLVRALDRHPGRQPLPPPASD